VTSPTGAPSSSTGAPSSSTQPTSSIHTWRTRIFIATWLCYAGYYFCRRPYYVVKGELGFDATTLGTIGALYLFSYALAQFAAGALGNRFGARAMLLTGMSVSIAANIGFGLASSSTAFFVLMTLNGAAQATGWSANVGTMAAWFNRSERGKVMGLWTTNFQAGGVAANALASFVVGHASAATAFFAGAAVLFAVLLVVVTQQRNRPEDVGHAPVLDPRTGLTDPGDPRGPNAKGLGWTRTVVVNILLVGVVYFFLKLIRYALWSWAPFFLAKNYGLEKDEAGYLSTLFDVCGVPGVIVTGWLSDRFFQSRRAGVSLVMTCVLIGSCVLLYTAGRVSVPVFAVGIALAGFSLYGPDALLTGAGAMDIGSRKGALLAAGIISGIGSLGPIVQELVIGRMYDANAGDLGSIFMLLVASSIAAALTLAVMVVRNRVGAADV
jgi:sugar phosphate permease